MRLPSSQMLTECVARLPAVVTALNGEVTRLTGKMPKDAIKAMSVAQKLSSTIPGRQSGLKEQKLPSGVAVRYLYQPDELEGGRRRATDPVWSPQVYRLGRSVTELDEPVLYYLLDGPRGGSSARSLLLCPLTLNSLRMGLSSVRELPHLCFCYTRGRSTLCCHGYALRRTAGYPWAGKPRGAQYCRRHSGYFGPPWDARFDRLSG